jgi:serine/threonine protein phosphatase PrpC
MGTLGKRVDKLEREAAARYGASDNAVVAVVRRIIAPNGDVLETIRREVQWRQST